jgi:hypothetical protein
MLEKHVPSVDRISPAELAVLQDVFDRLCQLRDIAPDSIPAERLAADLIDMFIHGIRKPKQLLAMLSGKHYP